MTTSTINIELDVNGKRHSVSVSPERRLLDVLREEVGLTGAKEGCGRGECGACTVLVNDQLVNSCLVPAFQADGARIRTVEGLGSPEQPSAVQSAFIAESAAQCGYCTPGMVVSVTGLIESGKATTRQEFREGLSGNICRCTGYKQILDAAEKAARGEVCEIPTRDGVGLSVPKVDALTKVTGRCKYTADLEFPQGCLHGVTVRAEHVHARLIDIRTDEAMAVPGVRKVLTWKDVPGELHYGNAIPDQPVFVKDHIRFWGEAVAVVLAETLPAAQKAAKLVSLEVEELPPVLDPQAALADGAPQLHPNGNLLVDQKLRKGDVDAAFAEADVVTERQYHTGAQEHLCLEPEAALATLEEDGVVVVKAPSQNVFFDRHHISQTLGLPKNRVRVIQQPTGAAFGSREDVYAQIHAALGALVTGQPTRIVWTREESQIATTKRHPAWMTYKAGATKDGRLLGLKISVLADTGAYASWAPNIARKALVHAAGPYHIENVSVDVRMAYTNNGISGAFRGFGAPQVAFAYESFMDELADELRIDPIDLRRKNHLAVGRVTATGQTVTGSCGLEQCLDRALEVAAARDANRPEPLPHIARGRGISTIFYGIGYGNAIPDIGSAILELTPEGRFRVRCGAIDYGQGSLTVFTQIACEVLGVNRDSVEIWTGDSLETPDSGSTVASRQTYVSGEAVRQASTRLKQTLLDFSSNKFEKAVEEMTITGQGITASGAPLVSLKELHALCLADGVKTSRQARFKAKTTKLDLETGQGNAYWPYAFAAHVADVEVNLKTGQVKVADIIAAHDVGKAINPAMVDGQIIGGVTHGLGFALFEEHRLRDGVPLTDNMHTYRVPGVNDVPDIVPVIVEDPEPSGPFGAKGVGEPVLVAIAPAIANAVANATGVRVRELPILAEKIRKGLRAGASRAGDHDRRKA